MVSSVMMPDTVFKRGRKVLHVPSSYSCTRTKNEEMSPKLLARGQVYAGGDDVRI